MLTLASLWMPILLSAVLVFFASSLIHMVFKWHNSDYRKLPNEDAVRAVLGSAQLPPGEYMLPHCVHGKEMGAPEMQQKLKDGPNGMLTLRANGMPNMGTSLSQWFVFALVLAALAACLSCLVLGRGAAQHTVFHFFALVTFMSYAAGSFVNGIWMGKPWRAVGKDALDSLIYAALTGAAFAWLWPQ